MNELLSDTQAIIARARERLLSDPTIARLVLEFRHNPTCEAATALLAECKGYILDARKKAQHAEGVFFLAWGIEPRATIISEQFNPMLREIWDALAVAEAGADFQSSAFLKAILR